METSTHSSGTSNLLCDRCGKLFIYEPIPEIRFKFHYCAECQRVFAAEAQAIRDGLKPNGTRHI